MRHRRLDEEIQHFGGVFRSDNLSRRTALVVANCGDDRRGQHSGRAIQWFNRQQTDWDS
jgi:hypothetical protein